MPFFRTLLVLLFVLGMEHITTKTLYAHEKVVLITGASRGIGYETAKKLASLHYKVYATSRSKPAVEENSSLHFLELDVTDDTSVTKAVNSIMQQEGRLDVLINNAGCAVFGPFELVSIEQAKNVFEVNFFGAMRLMQAAMPIMRAQKNGLIINVSSTSGVRPSPGWDLYAASKFALEGLSEAARAMARQWNVHVVIVEPGTTATDFMKDSTVLANRKLTTTLYDDFMPNALKWMQERLSGGQDPQEVADVIASIVATDMPNMRYQTSLKGTQTVAKIHCDPTGNMSTQDQEALVKPLCVGALDWQIGSSSN